MAKCIVELLEMIDIEHDHHERLFGTLHAPQLAVAGFLDIAAIEQSGVGITDRGWFATVGDRE
jgi:hypothetical protein